MKISSLLAAVSLLAVAVAAAPAAFAQAQAPVSDGQEVQMNIQRASIISVLSSQLAQSEAKNQELQRQLDTMKAQAQAKPESK
jgi:hypothetical protein